MSEERAVTWASEAHRKKDMRRRKIAGVKYAAWSFLHMVFWRVLHLTRLARAYSTFACWSNTYSKFPDGRCQWCGKQHSLERTSKEGG